MDRSPDDARPGTIDTRGSAGADVPTIPNARGLRPHPDTPALPRETRDRATHYAGLKAGVQAEYRAHAIDQGCERVRETEETVVTPAMLRIEAADPDRRLSGLEFRLKGKDRLADKVTSHLKSNPELTYDQAFGKVKDAIRHTFQYTEDHYAEGVRADIRRLVARFEPVGLRNSWPEEEYKGINSWCRVPENGQVFEVQFHTRASFEAKQFTHPAYEKIRDPATPKAERDELADFQRRVCSSIEVPPNAVDIRLP